MKALSLKQPWAELVVSGKKIIEIRNWNTGFRGEFLVHASKNPDLERCKEFGFTDLPTGCIVGKATLTDVRQYLSKDEFDADLPKHFAKGWWDPKAKGFILKDAKRIEPIPYKGMLNFFEVNL